MSLFTVYFKMVKGKTNVLKKSDFNFAKRVGYNWNSDSTSVFVIGRIRYN